MDVRRIIFIFAAWIFFATNFASAAPQTIEATGVYIMDTERDEAFAVAEDRARKEALRMAVEESGLYLQSISKTVNNKLTKDELQVLAAAVLKVQSESVSKKVDGKNIEFSVSIKAVVDTDAVNLDELVAKKKNWEQRVEENQRQQEEYETLKAENERLKADFAKASNENERKKIKAASIKNNKQFEANQYLDKSVEMLSAGEWLSSLDESKKALELDSTNADVLANRARAHVKANELETAKDEITKAIELNPKSNEYKIILGNVYFAAGEYDNAMAYYNEALAKDKNNAEAYFQRGMIYYNRDKNYDAALAEFNTAIAKKSDYAEVYYMRGMAYFSKNVDNPDFMNRSAPPNNLIGAFESFGKYLTFDNAQKKADAAQRRKQIGEMLSTFYRMNGDYANADKYLSATNDKETAATHIKRGQMYLEVSMNTLNESAAEKNARYDKAIAEFTKAIELEPNNAEAYAARAEVYVDKGWDNEEFMPTATETPLFDLARKDANKCLQLNPNHQGAKIVLERINSVSNVKNDYANVKNREQSMRDNLEEAMRRQKETMERIKQRK
ncbi:MAG: tetratricopeptide repeat protein [Quinella sp. 3Q1]|nr:tetratricopeptide repeat protein [Quinella sp. 3Q1]MBR6887176.1 tetratricopeptide repeat protein [Selenomonadaceae bacterium]